MDSSNHEEIEEILDEVAEEQTTLDEEDAQTQQKANLNKVGKKPLPPTKKSVKMEEEEEEEEEEMATNASKRGAGKNKYAGLYKAL